MEPEWTKAIPSESICNFFYVFFVLYAVFAALALITTFGVFSFGKQMGNFGIVLGIQSIITFLMAATFALFYYLICDRALLAGKKGTEQKGMVPVY